MGEEEARLESLSRRKKVQGGHRASVTRVISQVREAIDLSTGRETVMTRLKQYKLSLQE